MPSISGRTTQDHDLQIFLDRTSISRHRNGPTTSPVDVRGRPNSTFRCGPHPELTHTNPHCTFTTFTAAPPIKPDHPPQTRLEKLTLPASPINRRLHQAKSLASGAPGLILTDSLVRSAAVLNEAGQRDRPPVTPALSSRPVLRTNLTALSQGPEPRSQIPDTSEEDLSSRTVTDQWTV